MKRLWSIIPDSMFRHTFNITLILVMLLIAAACQLQQDRANDEEAIRAFISTYEAALNTRDIASATGHFAQDADAIFYEGPRRSGKDAIGRTMENFWTDAPSTLQVSITIEAIRFLGPDVAIVDDIGSFSTDYLPPNRGTWVLVRRDGVWQSIALRVLPAATQ